MSRFTTSFYLDANVASFLTMTPALLELSVDTVPQPSRPIPVIHHTTIPHLIRYLGSTRAAKAVIPGRPIEAVHLHSGDLAEDIVLSLAQSTASVVVLEADTQCLSIVLLELLARHLPSLAFCKITQPFTKAPDIVSVLSGILHNKYSHGTPPSVRASTKKLPNL